MKTSIIKVVGWLLFVLFEIALFAYLDKSTYLHKGVSLGDYKKVLPYYTKNGKSSTMAIIRRLIPSPEPDMHPLFSVKTICNR